MLGSRAFVTMLALTAPPTVNFDVIDARGLGRDQVLDDVCLVVPS